MRVDWLDRPLTAVEESIEWHLDGYAMSSDKDKWSSSMMLYWLDAALEYWLSRQAICCPDDVDNYELEHVRNIDGPWPGGEYEPTWE